MKFEKYKIKLFFQFTFNKNDVQTAFFFCYLVFDFIVSWARQVTPIIGLNMLSLGAVH